MLLALYAASAILPIVFVVFMILYLLVRGSSQVILCTECQQCKAVCPCLSKGCDPFNIMLAVKSGIHEIYLEGSAALCIACGKCQEACPRGLAPYQELERWRKKHPGSTGEAKR